jgi:hypothetical protein
LDRVEKHWRHLAWDVRDRKIPPTERGPLILPYPILLAPAVKENTKKPKTALFRTNPNEIQNVIQTVSNVLNGAPIIQISMIVIPTTIGFPST